MAAATDLEGDITVDAGVTMDELDDGDPRLRDRGHARTVSNRPENQRCLLLSRF